MMFGGVEVTVKLCIRWDFGRLQQYKSVVGLKSTSPEGFFAQELSQVQLSLEGIQIVSAVFLDHNIWIQ